MKKIFLTVAACALLAVSSIALIPDKADALPAFARQTGAACLSCHFQTFPALTSFGREFMFGSFTDVGDEGLIEGENLSIPAVLNASFDVVAAVTHNSGAGTASTTTYDIPVNQRLFVAGRAGEHTGAFIMFTGGSDVVGGKNVSFLNKSPTPVWMLLNSIRLNDDFQVGLGIHKSPWGASNAMEVSNVFGHRGDKLAGQDISGIKAAGFAKLTTGIGVWARYQDLGYIQFAMVAPAGLTTGVTNLSARWGHMVRVVATLDLNGWDTLIGFGYVTGTAGKGGTGGATPSGFLNRPNGMVALENAQIPMNLQFIDVQLQGDVGDMSVGIYGDWAHAPGRTSAKGAGNFYGSPGAPPGPGFGAFAGKSGKFNTQGKDFDAYSIRAELEPINRFLFGIGYGYKRLQGGAAGDIKTQTYQIAADYKIYQNFDVTFVYNTARTTDPTGTLNPNGLTSFTNRTTSVTAEMLM